MCLRWKIKNKESIYFLTWINSYWHLPEVTGKSFKLFRSSHRMSFIEKDVLKILQNFRVSFLIKFQASLWHGCFPGSFAKFLRAPFFYKNFFGGCFWLVCKPQLTEAVARSFLALTFNKIHIKTPAMEFLVSKISNLGLAFLSLFRMGLFGAAH